MKFHFCIDFFTESKAEIPSKTFRLMQNNGKGVRMHLLYEGMMTERTKRHRLSFFLTTATATLYWLSIHFIGL
ncbi:hypothetical protein SK41_04470 [Klebsiella aerogenes]|jgi:hypothetical protein|nr:hypothetical protein F8B42_01509 [Klebsiella aerogenes]KDF15401.1 hypothetical protein AF47_04327 [Klebsiella aerogenes MGH 61]KLV85097.1 hypothetical protein SK41_04470 [Klebsiella aerogenes]VDZ69579.1 Uncharacterised protein [Klebsiella aerogenes]